jgi:hypothetical protein
MTMCRVCGKKSKEMNMEITDHEKKMLQATGAKKIYAFFEELILKDSFQEEVKALRKKHQIPENGFMFPVKITCPNCHGSWGEESGEATLPPKEWIGYEDIQIREAFEEDLAKIEDEYGLLGPTFFTPLTMYIFFNSKFNAHFSAWQLCFIEDRKGFIPEDEKKRMDQSHPICIRISPYASSSDIAAFINASYSTMIKPLQERDRKQGFSVGKAKKKDREITERDGFIYSLRHLSLKEIAKRLSKKYGANSRHALDEGSTGKVLSLQNKKRKDL